MALKHIILAVGSVTALLACATPGDMERKPDGIAAFKDDPRLGEKVDKICFNRSIDGFSDARRDTVVLHESVKDRYLVEVSGVCRDLNYAQSIAIDSTLSCVTQSDYLIVSSSAFSLDDGTGLGPDRCLIKEIHKWNKDAKAMDEG